MKAFIRKFSVLAAIAFSHLGWGQPAAPVITNIVMVPRLTIQSDVGTSNQIQYSTNLTQTNWLTVSNLLVTESPYYFVDVTAPPSTQRYYRVIGTPTNDPTVAVTLSVTGLSSPRTAGTSGTLTVTARDSLGNVAVGYRGTVHFTSSDPQAGLPADYTFTAGDAGSHSFSVTLKSAGTLSASVTDTVNNGINGFQSGIIVNAGPATSLILSGLNSPRTAGVAGNVTVTAKDAYGNTATSFTGTVHFSSADPQAVLPSDYTFLGGDAGVKTGLNVTLKTSGTQSVSATDTTTGSITGTHSSITVNAGTVSTLTVAGLGSSRTAGVAGTVTITARDAYGNTAPSYTGTIHFTSTDPQAVLPSNYTFISADNGVKSGLAVTLNTSGTHSVTATDTTTGSINGAQTGIVVNPGSASVLVVAGISTPTTAGTARTVTVTAKDAYGNTAYGYTGTIHFSSTDPQASLPSNYTFIAADNGVKSGLGVTLKTSGTHSVTATDTTTGSINGAQTGIVVNPGSASVLVVAGISTPTTAGTARTVTITAKDAYGNTAYGYTGTIHFSSTDPQASLPSNYTFIAADNGVKSGLGVTLKTSGTHSVTATDTTTGSITGSQTGITVNAGTATSLSVTGLSTPRTANVAGSFSVTAKDAFGNTATSYSSRTVNFTSSDPQAVFSPTSYTFVAGDNGAKTSGLSVTLKTAGTQSIIATDTTTSSITGSQTGIVVNP